MELNVCGLTPLVTALRDLGIQADKGLPDSHRGVRLSAVHYAIPTVVTTYADLAQHLLTRFEGHTLNRIWVHAVNSDAGMVSVAALVDGKDWSLRECFGWSMGTPLTPEECATDGPAPEETKTTITGDVGITEEETPTVSREFVNASDNEFSDISSEASRTYNFGSKGFVKITNPLKLAVSGSGGHRIYDAKGQSHYIPSGWIHLSWTVKDGQPNFVK